MKAAVVSRSSQLICRALVEPCGLGRRARASGQRRQAHRGWCVLMTAALLLAAPWLAQAQDRVYRCGNEYTNQLKGRTGCKLLEGGNITIVRGTTPRATAPAAAPAGPAPLPGKTALATPTASVGQDAQQQRRETDARAILERELQRAQKRQRELEHEFNGGQPEKIGDEADDSQKYLDRIADLEDAIARNLSDIEGIERELQRYK